jgi:hypothetical protein
MNTHRYLFCCLLLCIACGDDEPEARTHEEFCRDWAAAACTSEVVDVCQAEGPEECRQTQEDFCRDLVPEDFSDHEGDACIDAVSAAYEDGELRGDELATVLKLGPPCDRLIVGPKSEGQSCSERTDCDLSTGFECVRKAGLEDGTCQLAELIEAGRDCEAVQATCETGFYCDGENCVEAKDAGDVCMIQEECGEEGYCSAEGECVARGGTGTPCTADLQCSEGICYEFEGEQTCTDRIVLSRAEPLCDELM